MRLLDLVAGTPISEALGWALVHSVWEGAVIAAALGAVLLLIRSPRTRYAAGCFALLAALVSFAITLIHFLPENARTLHAPLKAIPAPWRVLATIDNRRAFPDLATLIPWFAPLWLAGVCLFYLRYTAGWVSSFRLRRRGVCRAPDSWQRCAERLALELKVARPVVLLESLLADTPVVIGHLRPVILVPLGLLAHMPPDHVEAILLHELAHISRSDYLMNICQRLVEGLLFYHPAVWWISRVVRTERENCCDDAVIASRGDAYGYAVALTSLEQKRLEQQWPAQQVAVAATGGNLMKRIKRLLYPKGPCGLWAPVLAAIIFMASATVAIAAWHMNSDPPAVAGQSSNRVETPWQKWLDQDVVYIISDEERAAFEGLKTDEERQHFIEQFWSRRNPTPGTPENEFKKEHYRRIAYANDHFRTASGTTGWRTDRGRMYIVYGPPDEIDSHVNGSAKIPHPFESWGYRHVDGLGDNLFLTFVDQAGHGDYKLAPASAQ